MGCDIHIYPEVRQDHRWIYRPIYGNNEPGCYKLFGALAGVRSDECEPVKPPKGIPEVLSETTLAELKQWGEDAHTHSWLTLTELEKYDWKDTGLWSAIENIIWGMREFAEHIGPDNVRIVFWFDN